MDARQSTETLIHRNHTLLRQAAGTRLYSDLLSHEAKQPILRACAARELLVHRPMQRFDDEPSGDS